MMNEETTRIPDFSSAKNPALATPIVESQEMSCTEHRPQHYVNCISFGVGGEKMSAASSQKLDTNSTGYMAYEMECCKQIAKEEAEKRRQQISEKIHSDGVGVRRLRFYPDGSVVFTFLLEERFEVSEVLSCGEKEFVKIVINSFEGKEEVICDSEKFLSVTFTKEFIKKHFRICDVRILKRKDYLENFSNIIFSKIRKATRKKMPKIGWVSEREGQAFYSVVKLNIPEFVFLSNHNLPQVETLENISGLLKNFVKRNFSCIESCSYVILRGISNLIAPLVGEGIMFDPTLCLIGDYRAASEASNLLSLLVREEKTYVYSLQTLNLAKLKMLFQIPIDDVVIIDVSNTAHRKEIFSILSRLAPIDETVIKTPLALIFGEICENTSCGINVNVDNFALDSIFFSLFRFLKMQLLHEIKMNKIFRDELKGYEKYHLSSFEIAERFLLNRGADIWGQEVFCELVPIIKNASFFRDSNYRKAGNYISSFVEEFVCELRDKKLKIIEIGDCHDESLYESVIRKDGFLLFSKGIFKRICRKARFNSTAITKLRKDLLDEGYLKGYRNNDDFMIDVKLSNTEKKISFYAIDEKILDGRRMDCIKI